MNLSKSQISFLKKHKIPLEKVLDATGLKKNQYVEIMKSNGYIAAVGVSACKNEGHTMRSSSGHCIQCNPLSLVFRERHHAENYIYVAWSATKKWSKIGVSSKISQRQSTLKKQQYGGICDWEIVFHKLISNAGEVERNVMTDLSSFKIKSYTFKDGRDQETYELLSCPKDIVINSLKKYIF